MNAYIDRLPKQYRDSVRDFYKDDDGWWICLKEHGLYEFEGYASKYTIHEDTQLEAIRQFRDCIRRKNEERLYLAYGSNLNLAQMKTRCPGARLLGFTIVLDHRLIFRGSGSGNYLSIEPAPNSTKPYFVPCGVFSITEEDERNLDHYEGFPRFYRKKELEVLLHSNDGTNKQVKAMVYYLPKDNPAGFPSPNYVKTCKKGYADMGFNRHRLESALIRAFADTWEEI